MVLLKKVKGGSETGEATGAINLWRKSACSNDELYNYLLKNVNSDVANNFLKEGIWLEGIQIPKNSAVLNRDGSINWSKAVEGWGKGGAIQYEFSLTVEQLEGLGLLKEIK